MKEEPKQRVAAPRKARVQSNVGDTVGTHGLWSVTIKRGGRSRYWWALRHDGKGYAVPTGGRAKRDEAVKDGMFLLDQIEAVVTLRSSLQQVKEQLESTQVHLRSADTKVADLTKSNELSDSRLQSANRRLLERAEEISQFTERVRKARMARNLAWGVAAVALLVLAAHVISTSTA